MPKLNLYSLTKPQLMELVHKMNPNRYCIAYLLEDAEIINLLVDKENFELTQECYDIMKQMERDTND